MKIGEIMTREVEIATPGDTLQTAAKMMADIDAGILPVGENDRLVGVVTDRDIAVRGVAEGLDPKTATLREVMTGELRYAFEDEDIAEASRKMREWQIRRLPILNRDKRLVGIVAIGDLVVGAKEEAPLKETLHGISQPGHAEPAYAGRKPSGQH